MWESTGEDTYQLSKIPKEDRGTKITIYLNEENKELSEMTMEELRTFSSDIEADVFDVLTLEGSVNARDHIGGTAPKQVLAAAERAENRLNKRS